LERHGVTDLEDRRRNPSRRSCAAPPPASRGRGRAETRRSTAAASAPRRDPCNSSTCRQRMRQRSSTSSAGPSTPSRSSASHGQTAKTWRLCWDQLQIGPRSLKTRASRPSRSRSLPSEAASGTTPGSVGPQLKPATTNTLAISCGSAAAAVVPRGSAARTKSSTSELGGLEMHVDIDERRRERAAAHVQRLDGLSSSEAGDESIGDGEVRVQPFPRPIGEEAPFSQLRGVVTFGPGAWVAMLSRWTD